MNIVITGTSKGIGKELVKLFLKNSEITNLFCLSRSNGGLTDNPGFGNRYHYIKMDLEEEASIDAAVLQIKSRVDQIDILINNAGLLVNRPFSEASMQDALRVSRVNFLGPAYLIQQLLPLIGVKSFTHVVNISSMGGFQGSVKFPGLLFYSSAKAAIAVFTECLAVELQGRNASFNCLCLGSAQTEMLEEAFPGYRANLSAESMAEFIYNFSLSFGKAINGRIIPVSISNP